MMKTISYQDDFIEKAKEQYYRIKKQLEEKYPGDQYVSIDPETGEYVVEKQQSKSWRNPKNIIQRDNFS